MTAQQELFALRISVSKVAQVVGVQSSDLPVLNKPFNELATLASQPRGWNTLCASIIERINGRAWIDKSDARVVVAALKAKAAQENYPDHVWQLSENIARQID